jgi:hypothetical protein
VDVRISSIPSTYGERIVMRLLDKSARVYKLSEIGLDKANEDILRKYVKYTHGVIFVTGPTGSGKTTTLYAALTELNTQEKNILTIEDPVEYNLHGISQVQVNTKKGLTFAAGLRSFLRQDPDIMMIGEVRDSETARHRHPRRAHRPPRALHPAHQRLGLGRHAHARHRRRALPRVQLGAAVRGPAPRARHLPQVQDGT